MNIEVLRRICGLIAVFWLGLLPVFPAFAASEVVGLSIDVKGGDETILLSFDGASEFKVFALETPPRLVLDVPTVEYAIPKALPVGYQGVVKQVRAAQFDAKTTRIVFDLKRKVNLGRAAGAMVKGKYRLAIPFATEGKAPVVAREDWVKVTETAAKISTPPADLPFATIPVPVFKNTAAMRPVIVIDAGHGGRDPGAQGIHGTHEKDITLGYALALRHALSETGRYDVFLTRESDIYIPLRDRMHFGREKKASLFISIHADSAQNRATRGLSIYTLSETASDAEAAALAQRENKVDLVYGLNLSTDDKDVTEILIDLAQRETRVKSQRVAEAILRSVSAHMPLLQRPHRSAGFAVLKAPDVPSVLVELGFLTNDRDEQLLKSPGHRRELVQDLVQGINRYFDN